MVSKFAADRAATSLPFFAAGTGLGAWAVNIPLIKEGLTLSELELGAALFGFAIGAILIMPFIGRVLARTGPGRILLTGGIGFALMLAAVSLTWNLPALIACMFLMGVAFGSVDVTMNSRAATVEANHGQPLMSSFHGMFSVGQLAGAGLSSAILAVQPSAAVALTFIAVLIAGCFALSPAGPAKAQHGGGTDRKPGSDPRPWTRMLIVAGALAFLSFLAEGVFLDWSAVYMVEDLGAAEYASAVAFCGFAGAMAIGRLLGDRIVRRFGHVRTQRLSGLATLVGIVLFLLSGRLEIAAVGLVLSGFGLANVIPILFAVAGQSDKAAPSVAVSRVAAVGYSGLLIGPPVIGVIAEAATLSAAFGVVFVSMVVVTLGAPYLRAKH